MDASLVKIDKIIEFQNAQPASFSDFSIRIIPATATAIGFDLSRGLDEFSSLDWSAAFKIVNSSKEDLIIENMETLWKGKNNYRCKSISTQVFTANGDTDQVILEQLLEHEDLKNQIVHFPFLLKARSEKIIRGNFFLYTYKRIFLNYWKHISFERTSIKEPETYAKLVKSIIIKTKVNKRQKPLLIEIK